MHPNEWESGCERGRTAVLGNRAAPPARRSLQTKG